MRRSELWPHRVVAIPLVVWRDIKGNGPDASVVPRVFVDEFECGGVPDISDRNFGTGMLN